MRFFSNNMMKHFQLSLSYNAMGTFYVLTEALKRGVKFEGRLHYEKRKKINCISDFI